MTTAFKAGEKLLQGYDRKNREGKCKVGLKAGEWRIRCRPNNSFHPRGRVRKKGLLAGSQWRGTKPCPTEPDMQDPQESKQPLLPLGQGELL